MKERKKGCGFGWERRWGESGRLGGGETTVRIYCMKKSIFNKIFKTERKNG